MSYKLLSKEKNKVKIEVVLANEEFGKYVEQTYKKTKGRFNIQGFRKGKAPRQIIEMQYGEGVFYDDALNELLPVEYGKAVEELNISPVGRPDVDVVEIGKDVDLKFTVEVEVKPEIELGEYKGVEVKKPDTKVKDEELEAELQKMVEMNARIITVEDRAIEDGDIVIIDYKGSSDGVEFEGGTAENHSLTIGSNEFIPGFEEQLIGAKVNDEVKVNITFPEDYHAEDLAGKEAVFEVKIHEIKTKELPKLDDDFAIDTSEFDTLEELKESTRKTLEEKNIKSADEFIRNSVVEKAVENVNVEIPNDMIESELDFMIKDMEHQLSYSGINMEQYLSFTNSTLDDMKEQMKEDATQRVKTQLIIEKIGEVEKIEVSEDDIKTEIDSIVEAEKSTIEEVEKIYSRDDYSYLKDTIKTRKIIDLLVENAKVTE
ncbi:MAG: trigger factor [Clostridiales bacterium]|nr:trigger factor [Clostridiales bacterium]